MCGGGICQLKRGATIQSQVIRMERSSAPAPHAFTGSRAARLHRESALALGWPRHRIAARAAAPPPTPRVSLSPRVRLLVQGSRPLRLRAPPQYRRASFSPRERFAPMATLSLAYIPVQAASASSLSCHRGRACLRPSVWHEAGGGMLPLELARAGLCHCAHAHLAFPPRVRFRGVRAS